jgi:hypothetical protein
MTEASLARFAFIVGAMGALLAGCAQPNPDTAAGRSEIAGQKCTLCIVQNPGDYNSEIGLDLVAAVSTPHD